jgi:hypothetical protein
MKKNIFMILVAASLAMLLAGCSTTTLQTRSTQMSGFLSDYSMLKKGDDEQALLRYVNPAVDFKSYDKLLIEPIQVFAAPQSKLAKTEKKDVEALVNYLHATVLDQLRRDYTLVQENGPGVMRLRIALTEAKGSKLVLDTLSSAIPVGMAISAIKQIAVGTPTSVGSARVEMEMVDSLTGTRLAAAVDERAGRKYTGQFDKWKKWQDARDAYDHWALQLKTRLAQLAGK